MTAPSILLGERTAIDVRAIEREVTHLWHETVEHSPDTVARVCVLNLIIATHSSSWAEQATDIVAQLTERHPNRAIVVRAQPEEAPLLDAWVQAHCQLPGVGRPQVCCEQITIEAHGDAINRVPGTVLSLLVPDVPVVLWWPSGASFDDPLFVRLSAFADRVIVDSTTFDAPEADLARMVALCDADQAISDMAWGQLTPWRELAAQFFDVPALVPHLAQVKRLAVEYEAQPDAPADRTQALLLLGWFAGRLGWTLAGHASTANGVTTIPMHQRDGHPITVDLCPAAPQEDALARLASLTLECETASFYISRDQQPNCAIATAHIGDNAPLRRVVRLERLGEADLLSEELRLLGRDLGFESALRMAAQLVQEL